MASKNRIIQNYLLLLQTDKESLQSVAAFCKKTKIKEAEFFEKFNRLEQVEQSFWTEILNSTLTQLEKEDGFIQGSSRERILFLFYTLLENLKEQRSYVLYMHKYKKEAWMHRVLDPFKQHFDEFIRSEVASGLKTKEMKAPKLIQDKIYHSFWLNWLFVLDFWCKDESAQFELTDAAVEKSLNLSFDLLGNGLLDRTIDFGKFLFQQYRPV